MTKIKNTDNLTIDRITILRLVMDFIDLFGLKTSGGIIKDIRISFVSISEATPGDISVQVSYIEGEHITNVVDVKSQ